MRPGKELVNYIEQNVFPIYTKSVDCHRLEHVKNVIKNSLGFAAGVKNEKINIDMVYTIAAFHDVGISKNRETHEIVGAEMLRADKGLAKFFTKPEIVTMANAVEDHRASNPREPRSVYGKIVSSADRRWDLDDALGVMLRYRQKYMPQMTLDEMVADARQHSIDKFGENGYAISKIYFKSSEYEKFITEIQALARDPEKFRAKFLSVNGLTDAK
jgi:uncharacterized protein